MIGAWVIRNKSVQINQHQPTSFSLCFAPKFQRNLGPFCQSNNPWQGVGISLCWGLQFGGPISSRMLLTGIHLDFTTLINLQISAKNICQVSILQIPYTPEIQHIAFQRCLWPPNKSNSFCKHPFFRGFRR